MQSQDSPPAQLISTYIAEIESMNDLAIAYFQNRKEGTLCLLVFAFLNISPSEGSHMYTQQNLHKGFSAEL